MRYQIAGWNKRPVAPGMKWCPRCQAEKPLTEFSGRKKLGGYCRPCKAVSVQESRKRQVNQPDELVAPKFWAKVEKREPDDCWLWTGVVDRDGYGRLNHRGNMRYAHRLSMVLAGFDVPTHLRVDHKCKVRHCVNPGHLRVVTEKVNAIENNDSPQAINARKTHCIRGHAFTPANTAIYVAKNQKTRHGHPRKRPIAARVCLACRRERRQQKGASQ